MVVATGSKSRPLDRQNDWISHRLSEKLPDSVEPLLGSDVVEKWILNAFKADATRTMSEADCWHSENIPWVRRGSKRYLWTEQQLLAAIAYVQYDQGEPLP